MDLMVTKKIKVVTVLAENKVSPTTLLQYYLSPVDVAILPVDSEFEVKKLSESPIKEIYLVGAPAKPVFKDIFPKINFNLIGPVRLTELRSLKYDLNIGIMGENHNLGPVCKKAASYIYPDEYLRDYIIPSFAGDTLDVYLEGNIGLLKPGQMVEERQRLAILKRKGCPF